MKVFRALFYLMKADFLERVRRYSFIFTIGIAIFIAYKYIPPKSAGYLTLCLGEIRGVYNSAWLGSALALLSSTVLSIPAFYLVKNSIQRDFETGVGQIISTTPLKRTTYFFGKALSNFAVLFFMVLVIALSTIFMQLVRGEDTTINLPKLLNPFLFSTIPTMILVSALAVFFESVSFLRKSIGNVIYFFGWIGVNTAWLMSRMDFSTGRFEQSNDIMGITPIISGMVNSARNNFPGYVGDFIIGMTEVNNSVKTFVWDGVEWNIEIITGRIIWVGVSLIIVLLASILFKGFDSTYSHSKKRTKKDKLLMKPEIKAEGITTLASKLKHFNSQERTYKPNYIQIIIVELKLLLKGVKIWWYIGALILICLDLFIPLKNARTFIFPLTWLWPIFIWSSMGMREKYYRTTQIVFIAPKSIIKNFFAAWSAGIIVTLLTGIGMLLNITFSSDYKFLIMFIVSAFFIPTLALTLGVWSGNKKLFEVIYLVLWYIGPFNRETVFDFMGTSSNSALNGTYVYFLLISMFLLLAAVVKRAQQQKV